MATADGTWVSPSTLDALIRLAKKISLLTGLVTGLGLVALYFFGIAIFTSYASAFGVPSFEFSLQHCLEYGGAYAGVILTLLPLLAVYGIVDYFREAGLLLPLAYTILYFLVISLVMISTLMPRGFFLDPAMNVVLNHREELTAGADPVKFGIRHWDGFTLNMVIRDKPWKVAKIGETFLMGLLAAVYGFLTIRYSDRSIAGMRAAGGTSGP